MNGTVILVEIDVTSPAGETSTLRFADRAIRPFPPTAAGKANLVWDDRLKEPPAFREALFEDVTTLTPSLGAGTLQLVNTDHALDAYQAFAWGEIRIWRWTEGTPFSAAVSMLKGLCGLAEVDATVRVPLYDYRAELEKAIQETLYAGGNGVGGVLYEGVAGGLKGRPKPLALGDLTGAHIPGPQVNAGQRVHQLHDGPIQGNVQIFDGGVDAGYAAQGDLSGAAFDGATPAAASYRTDIGRGLVKINGAPVLGLTFGCKGDKAGGTYVETPGPVLARLLAKGGVPAERIGASVPGLASASVVGVFASEPVNAMDLAAFVGRSALAAVLPDREGVWQAIPFAPPAETADFALAFDQIVDFRPEPAPAPVGEIRVGWGRIYTTFSRTELKASVRDTDDEERLAAEYRYAVVADEGVKARFPKAWATVTIDTALRTEAAAEALAEALRGIVGLRPDGAPRRMWKAPIVNDDAALAVHLGATVAVDYPPLGVAENFLLVARDLFRPQRRDQAVWTLWG
ncbi:MAG: hypothetical protein ACK41C_10485 [Phenylobacterium sp.]|uniref:hypothetical protein n=1 Tax=Phenylobacterium sp. TaxID=1871053 RepID=UPI00391A9A50